MFNTKNISSFAITCFLINMTLSQLILTLPLLFSRIAGTASWILSLYIFILMYILITITYKLYKPFTGIGIFSISKFLGGNILYFITTLLYSIVFIIITIIYLREVSETIKTLLFNTASITYISLFFIIAMVICSTFELEAITRANGYLIPLTIISIILTILFTISYMRIDRLFPIFGNGLKGILINGSTKITSYIGYVYLFLFAKYIKDAKQMKNIAFKYLITSFILITICLLANSLIFSYPYTISNHYSLYEIAKLTNLNLFFQRSEIIYTITLMIISFCFLIAVFYGTYDCIKSLITKNDKYAFTPKTKYIFSVILGIIVYIISNLPKNLLQIEELFNYINNFLILPIIFIFPIFILIFANIKIKKNRGAYEKFISNNN